MLAFRTWQAIGTKKFGQYLLSRRRLPLEVAVKNRNLRRECGPPVLGCRTPLRSNRRPTCRSADNYFDELMLLDRLEQCSQLV